MSEQENLTMNTENKKHKRRHYAAPLGFLMLLLSLIGAITVIVGAVNLIVRWSDDTPLREDLYSFLNPVMQFCPSTFDNAGGSDENHDALLLSAVYRVTEAERIRQLREKDDTCIYALDETQYRMQIPQDVIEKSFAHLFGDVKLTNRTVGEVEYNADKKMYLVPTSINTAGYTPVLGDIDKDGDVYTVEVAYVANGDVEVDEKGNTIPPSFDMGKYTQNYTLKRNKDTWTLVSVSATA